MKRRVIADKKKLVLILLGQGYVPMGGYWESEMSSLSFADEMWMCCGERVRHNGVEGFVAKDKYNEYWVFRESWTELYEES